MYNIKLLNKISKNGTDVFDEKYVYGEGVEDPDAILVRSAAMHDMQFGKKLLAIARAGAGVNNIPTDRCAEEGIVVFNTPGANANAVKELVIAGMLLAARDVVGGIEWVRENASDPDIAKSVEKNKSKFAGSELRGKKLGVIGLGAIGGPLSNTARHFGMEVYGCDPYITIDAAWNISRDVKRVKSNDEIFETCDYITLHVPLIKNADPAKSTEKMIGKAAFDKMKDGVVILNFARDALVDDDALAEALESGKVSRYVTDFPNAKTANMKNVIAIPHLGASTEESEDNCAVMAAHELRDYLENGNIKNSVNFPDASLPHSGDYRLCVLHKNTPGIVAQLATVVADEKLNIANMVNRSRGDNAYTIIEINGSLPQSSVDKVNSLENIIRTRVIENA
ncbi:MAG: phosphoglycerate dehydrogenase [Clostridia bacterium]|nr:phosphoglycerate dehydrogenase [Clostridia bacterium]